MPLSVEDLRVSSHQHKQRQVARSHCRREREARTNAARGNQFRGAFHAAADHSIPGHFSSLFLYPTRWHRPADRQAYPSPPPTIHFPITNLRPTAQLSKMHIILLHLILPPRMIPYCTAICSNPNTAEPACATWARSGGTSSSTFARANCAFIK